MNWVDTKKALSDRFTPAELIEMIDIDTETLLDLLDEEGFLNGTELEEILEIAQLGDQDD